MEQGRKRDRRREEGPEQDFCFLVGLHANTLERIVQLRELKKCVIQVRGMERGREERERGMNAEHIHTQKKKRSEIEALRAKNAGRGGIKRNREHYHLHHGYHHHGYSFCFSLYTLEYLIKTMVSVCDGSCQFVTCKKKKKAMEIFT